MEIYHSYDKKIFVAIFVLLMEIVYCIITSCLTARLNKVANAKDTSIVFESINEFLAVYEGQKSKF